MHAIDQLFPGTANHGELAGVGALFSAYIRGNEQLAAQIDLCLLRHDLPRGPAALGLTIDQFTEAVVLAPSTRPDRYTVLEYLDLDPAAVRERVVAFTRAFAG
jgi:glycerol-1-phosphate dehydrogenase [NAD(P)+]